MCETSRPARVGVQAKPCPFIAASPSTMPSLQASCPCLQESANVASSARGVGKRTVSRTSSRMAKTAPRTWWMVAPTSDVVMMSSLSAGRDRRVVLSCSNSTVWGVAAPWGEPQAAVALFAVVVLSESAREDLFWNTLWTTLRGPLVPIQFDFLLLLLFIERAASACCAPP